MIFLSGEVCTEMYSHLVGQLRRNPRKVEVILNSEGGDLLHGLAIYDRLKMIPDCTITATGENASAATIILQAGTLRRATPTTQFYFHLSQIYDPPEPGKPQEDNPLKHFREKVYLDQVMFKIYNTRLTPAAIREALARKIFGVEIALKLGIIDSVWEGK